MNTENNLMQEDVADYRWRQIRRIWDAKENQWLYMLVGFIVGLLLVPFLALQPDILGNLFPEALGILFTVLVIDQLNERRAERLCKEELILQMGSPHNAFAIEAVRILRQKGWLTDDSLKGANLNNANLSGADLNYSKLKQVSAQRANLAHAQLRSAELEGSFLGGANLSDASLLMANCFAAFMQNSDMTGAQLEFANLRGAVLEGANMMNAVLNYAHYDENTILPDEHYWTPNTDMRRFTDSNHPNFWRSDNPSSPAY